MPIYLNLGSGQRKFGVPWTNVDAQDTHEPDICADAQDYLEGFAENKVNMICLHHVLEHFGCGEADSLLEECHRVLKPNHSLLIFVPDMWELSLMWREGRLSDQVYMTNVYGAYMGDEADRHKWGFTSDSLLETVKRAGFSQLIHPFNYRPLQGADIAKDEWILSMEAVK